MAKMTAKLCKTGINAGKPKCLKLFITAPAGERIEVAFVDPDAEPEIAEEPEAPPSTVGLAALARRLGAFGVDFVPVMGEIEPHDIHPGLDQLVEYFGVVRGRAEGGDDFGST